MASAHNLYIDQGADFNAQLQIFDDNNAPWDLTGYTGSAKIKKSYYSTTSVLFVVSFPVSRTSGYIILELSSTQTSEMEQGRYLYDVVLTNTTGGKKTRVLEGIVTINPGVTK
jgi:hypothetical protein